MKQDIVDHCYRVYRHLQKNNALCAVKNRHDLFGVLWANADNILFGELGDLFFLLELYTVTKDAAVWKTIAEKLGKLEEASTAIPVNNYTFYCGRMGLVFLYTKLFCITGNDIYITRAVDICRRHRSDASLTFMLLNNNSLYDGIAGALVCLIHLYRTCYDKEVLSLIEVYTRKLMENIRVAEKGIYWGGITNTSLRRLGFGYGMSGIAFALLEVAKLFDNNAFVEVAYQAFAFEDQFWVYETGGWDQFGDNRSNNGEAPVNHAFLNGASGMALARLYADYTSGIHKYASGYDIVLNSIPVNASAHTGPGICNGLAGSGLAMLEAYSISGDLFYAKKALHAAAQLLQNEIREQECAACCGSGFGYGRSGIAYFLLRTIEADSLTTSVFFPRSVAQQEAHAPVQLDSILLYNEEDIGDMIGQANFKSSYPLLKKHLHQPAKGFSAGEEKYSSASFISSMRAQMTKTLNGSATEDIINSFEKDCFVLSVQSSLNRYVYQVTSFPALDDIVAVVRLAEKDFLDCSFIISPAIWVHEKDPVIDLSEVLSYSDAVALFSGYGENSFVCKLTPFDALMVEKLGLDKLIFDRYKTVSSVRQVYAAITDFFMKQEMPVIEMLLFYLNLSHLNALHDKLKEMVIRATAFYFMEGVLQLVSPGASKEAADEPLVESL